MTITDLIHSLGVIALAIIAWGLVDMNDRRGEDGMTRAQYARFVEDSCFPKRQGDRAVATLEGEKLNCTLYGNTGHGRAPVLISAATMERP